MYLDAGALDTILLPSRYVTPDMRVGTEVEVFIYNDSEDRLVASTETPYAQVGEFAYLEVTGLTLDVGAFLDWGLSKDLLLPYREQGNLFIRKGDGVVVAVYLDAHTNRIVVSTRLHRHLAETAPDYQPNDAVEARGATSASSTNSTAACCSTPRHPTGSNPATSSPPTSKRSAQAAGSICAATAGHQQWTVWRNASSGK